MSIYPPTGTLEIKNATLKIPVVDLQYTSNTAKLEANSNVVTEFSRSKKLIKYPRVALTSAAQTESGYEGYFVSQASGTLNTNSSRQAWAFFDIEGSDGTSPASPHLISSTDRFDSNGNYTGGDSLANVSGDWIYIRLPDKIQLQSVALWARYGGDRNPIDATVLGSLNGTIWSVLGSWTGASFTAGKSSSFTINSIQYYDYIGFVFEKIEASSSGRYVNFHEIDLYGVPEYDPEAHGTDVTVKSYPNVPNTDWLEVYYDAKDLEDDASLSSVSGLGGTTINGTTLGDPQVSNKAFVFDGSGDAIVSGATSLSGNPPLSYSVWFKTNSIITGNNSIVMIGYAAGTKSIGFRIQATTGMYRFYVYSGATNESVNTDIKAKIGIWTHATVVYDGLNSKLYIDGQFALQNTNTSTTLALDSGAKVTLGNYIDLNGNVTTISANDSYDGSIANFRLFNRVLTIDEIYQLYAYQKQDFGHGDLSMTLKAGRLGIGTSEPRAALDVRGPATFTGRPIFTESLFFYTGNTPTNYYASTYKNRHEFYLNTLIPPNSHIGNYGTGGDTQVFTESSYGGSNELCGSHFDCMVYWLKNAPVGHVHRLNWCSNNGSGGSQTYGQKTSGTQIRLWGYWFHTGTYDKDWTNGADFNISTSTVSVLYEGATFQ